MRLFLLVLPILGAAIPAQRLLAQSLDCAVDDQECLSDNARPVCLALGATAESCLSWIRLAERHALAGNPEWRLAVADKYLLAAELTSFMDLAQQLRQQSRSIFQDLIVSMPDSQYAARAYRGLASIASVSGDIDARISALRNAARIQPSSTTMMFLADALAERGDVSEAADVYRTAYQDSGDPPAWSFARRAIGLYAASDHPNQAIEFREQVARDTGMVEYAEEVISGNFPADLEHAATVLNTACDRMIAVIFGPATCENGIEAMVAATRSGADLARRQTIADISAEAMSELAVLGAYTHVTAAEKSRRDAWFASILQEWIESGAATARVYVLWSQNPYSNLNASLIALESAVELAPNNGQYRYWFALALRSVGRLEEAIAHLRLARENIPENVGLTPERIDERIRELESARSMAP